MYTKLSGTNAVMAQKRMLERKMNKKAATESAKHVLKQFKKDGEEHFLVIKKKNEVLPAVEDIFADWKPNLVDAHEQRKQAAIHAR